MVAHTLRVRHPHSHDVETLGIAHAEVRAIGFIGLRARTARRLLWNRMWRLTPLTLRGSDSILWSVFRTELGELDDELRSNSPTHIVYAEISRNMGHLTRGRLDQDSASTYIVGRTVADDKNSKEILCQFP